MKNIFIIHRAIKDGYVHVVGIMNDNKVHIHISENNFNLYEDTELNETLKTIIAYYQIELRLKGDLVFSSESW